MVEYSPFSEVAMKDPHEIYRQLRREAPVYYLEEFDAWALSTFDDIWTASMDRKHFTSTKGATGDQLISKTFPIVPMLFVMDPPDHTTARSALRPFFGPGCTKKMAPLVQTAIDDLMGKLAERDSFDAVADLGDPLAGRVGAMTAGLPLEDVDLLIALVRRFHSRIAGHEGMTADGTAAFQELSAYLVDFVTTRRKNPNDVEDPLNALLGLDFKGRRMGDEEIGTHLLLLILGGFETFPKVFAAALRRIWEHPDQRVQAAEDKALIPGAFVESARFDMPTQFLGRTVFKEIKIRDKTLRPGQPVIFLYASANRDEAEFKDPDRFDITRESPRILSFGHGQHSCLGIHVAKLEGRIGLETMLDRFPNYEIDLAASERYVTEFIQGFSRLEVRPRG